jgi:hypothetical protein
MQYLQHRLQQPSTSTKLSFDEMSDGTHELDDEKYIVVATINLYPPYG